MPTYKLHIVKKPLKKDSTKTKPRTYYAIVDLDKGTYPKNFVCTFPITKNLVRTRVFYATHFSRRPLDFAEKLLESAKEEYDDREIQQDLDIRLSQLREYKQKKASTPFSCCNNSGPVTHV